MGPRFVLDARLQKRRTELERLSQWERAISRGRLAVAIAAAGLGIAVWQAPDVSAVWLAVPAVVFAALVVVHDRVLRRTGRLGRAVRFCELALSRVDRRIDDDVPTGSAFAPADHPFATDLDLFGRHSLFALLCTCRTQPGEATLARWLLEQAPAPVARERQAAAAELAPRLDLREDLFVRGAETRSGLHPATLVEWGMRPVALDVRAAVPLSLLAVAGAVAVAGWITGAWGALSVAAILAIDGLSSRALAGRAAQVLAAVDGPGRELRVLASVMRRIETEPVESPALVRVHAVLRGSGRPASAEVARLARLVELAEARHNQLFAPIAFVLLWGPLFAIAIEGWRRRCGAAIGRWIEAAGELEALAAFGAYAFEHPDDPFCEIVDDGPCYEAEGLAHPLLPPDGAVRNDVRLGDPVRLLVVSGSNMSGKSTLLRSIGASVVLGLAGCPVRALRLRLSPLVPGASLHVADSLHDGTSRFMAEIRRDKRILDLTGAGTPVLFLLDEILHGTNSHDRFEGAEAIVSALLERGAIGLVTTHDLALTGLADSRGQAAANVHFVDAVRDGRLSFDYTLKPGVVKRSNAIELMRSVGLPV